MIVTEITNHVQQALDRLMQQYKGKPNLQALITAIVDQVQDIEDGIYPLDAGRQLWNGTTYPSVGAQLDGIGELVGVARNGLSDSVYLIFILGTIAENFSDTTIETMLNIIGILFQSEHVFLKELYPAAVALEVGTPLTDPSLFDRVLAIVEASLGAGIGLAFAGTFTTVDDFAFAGPDTTSKGFADPLIPGSGGKFAVPVFTNTTL